MLVLHRLFRRVLVAGVLLLTATAYGPPSADAQASGEPLFCDGNPIAAYAAGRRERPRLLPVDESVRAPDLVSLRRTLLEAVRRRDVNTIVQSAAQDIVLGFEGERGPEHFRRLIEGDGTDFWVEFGRVLTMGGSFEGDEFVAPYVTSTWKLDIACDRAIVGRRVRLRAGPDLNAAVLAMLDYDVVEQLYVDSIDGRNVPVVIPNGWSKVRIASGIVGFVSEDFLRSRLDYRARFERRAGRWRLVAFVAGD